MKVKKYLLVLVFIIAAVTYCQSQNIQYRSKIRPNVRAKLDSLYPHAKGIVLEQYIISDTTQTIAFGCNCEETKGEIILVFDTNANLRNKEVHYTDIKNLPDTIVNYMKKDAAIPNVKVFNDYMIKSTNSKGEITYSIAIQEYAASYILKFKPSGELISKEIMPGGEQ